MLEWIESEGFRILVMHAENLPDDKVLEAIGEFEQAVLRTPPGVRLLSIANTSGDRITTAMRDRWSQFLDRTRHVDHIRTNVGAQGFGRVVAGLLVPDIYFAKSMDDAVQYLVKKSKSL